MTRDINLLTASEHEWPSYLTPDEVAVVFRLSRRTIERRLADGELPCVRIGGKRRIPRARLSALLHANELQHRRGDK